jgi:integrase
MAGVPQRTIMEILGHRDPRMTIRYQHLAPGHLRDAIKALDACQAQAGADSAPALAAQR